MTDFLDFLRNNPYPGRGIAVGKNRVYYFIMGRSENSRNRIFTLTDDGIQTEAYDKEKLTDPSLIIYHPVRRSGSDLIVTNGDQTDTILQMGDFRKAFMTREFEPDAPNNTPRISAVLHKDGSLRCRSSSVWKDAASASSSAMKAVMKAGGSSSAPMRVPALPSRASRVSRWRSTCPSRKPSGPL